MSAFDDDLNGLGDPAADGGVAVNDPAAEFLQREQDELAGLEDELQPAAAVAAGAAPTATATNGDLFAGGDDMTAAAKLEPSVPTQVSGGSGSGRQKVESEKIRLWREEQETRLQEKDREEEARKVEWKAAAKKELEDWYRAHNEQITKTKASNRSAEKQFVADGVGEPAPGTEWERIAALCEFNPKSKSSSAAAGGGAAGAAAGVAGGPRDVSRMRSIILQKKQAQQQQAAA